jgi:hypothetical protein
VIAPACEIHCTRYGNANVIAFNEWLERAEIDTDGHVASLTVPTALFDFDDLTELDHAMVANVRYEITKHERVECGWKLWLHASEVVNDAE